MKQETLIDIDWGYKIPKNHSTNYGKNKKQKKYTASKPVRKSVKNEDNPSIKYKFIYGTAFLGIFGVLFFLSISISSAANIRTPEKTYNDDMFFDEYPERHLESMIFADEPSNSDEKNESPQLYKSKKLELSKYRVKNKDTIEKIAKKFGLTVDSVILANNLKKNKTLVAGDMFEIPNQDGRTIKVGKNDSIYKISSRYGCSMEDIADINNLDSSKLIVGQKLFIPEAGMTQFEKDEFYGNLYIWPTVSHVITSNYGPRKDPITGKASFHSGIDLKGPVGTPVYSVKDGVVTSTGYGQVYGNYVEIKHSNNLLTRYAHLSKISVKKGDKVVHGDIIGKIGSTGRSTGPHLHFEIRKKGKLLNPIYELSKK